ncbi:MAG: 1,4-alpha-glucan branching protein GlgB [Verrucomicrobiota bacterium]|nr:1,4-alpha-glucan branching protein GlgB [Verrucomicrobiota bacterium]
MLISRHEMEACISGTIGEPHYFLGMHAVSSSSGLVARAWDPFANKISLIRTNDSKRFEMNRIDDRGFFELHLKGYDKPFAHSLHSIYENGERTWVNPYCFSPVVTNESLSDFNSGVDRRPFHKLGAIPFNHEGVVGISFCVWAPSAKSVHLVGDFNLWNPQSLPMRSLGSSGCRELFVPFAQLGDKYKFRVLGADGVMREKTDPFGWQFEGSTGNAAIISERFETKSRSQTQSTDHSSKPISIYEIHLGSWKFKSKKSEPLSYLELADELPKYLKETGFTHVEFLPLTEYPYVPSWGYQVTGYYAPTHRYGKPAEFAFLVESIQESGIGVILDWVPGHFPADEFALSKFDGTCLFEHQDPRQGIHAEWGTLCYNYGQPEVRSFLIGSAIAWLDRFGIDGFRVDAVASMLYLDYGRQDGEWIANREGGNLNYEAIDFIRHFNQAIHEEYDSVLSIAEESTSFPKITKPVEDGGLGFDFKWNMGWMHDVIDYFSNSPSNRSCNHGNLTFGALYQFSENFMQAFSHDEVVHGKGALVNKMGLNLELDKIANLKALLALQWLWPGKKNLFMGCEFAQWKEWDFESSIDWELLKFPQHNGVKLLIADLNHFYQNHPTWAKYDHVPEKFQWIDCGDAEGQTLSFLKYGDRAEDTIMVICNFSTNLKSRDWGVPHVGKWKVFIDTDSAAYNGDGKTDQESFQSFNEERNGQPYGLTFPINRLSVKALSLSQESFQINPDSEKL